MREGNTQLPMIAVESAYPDCGGELRKLGEDVSESELGGPAVLAPLAAA